MTIQPISNRPREISVTEPIEPAYERVKLILFQPFDFTKWIVIGFCAWLAGLGEAGGSGAGFHGSNGINDHNRQPVEEFRHFYQQASDYVVANLGWIVPLFICLVLLGLAICVTVLWLNSRGKFMFLHCVVWNQAEIDVPWSKFAGLGNSLFWFRLVVIGIGMVLMLPLLGLIAATILHMVRLGEPDVPGVLLAVGLGLVLIFLSIVLAVIRKFTVDFVVPIMFLRQGACAAAWREFWGLLSANPGQFTIYILFQIVLGIAIAAIIMMGVLATCCTLGCLLALPFLGTVLLLPVLVFKRAFSLYYLAQYGPQYDVFPQPPAPPATLPQPSPLAPVAR